MKKPQIFMMAYICVLWVLTFILTITQNPFINTLACAATISGYLFSVADIYLQYANISKTIIEKSKKQMKEVNAKIKEALDKNTKFLLVLEKKYKFFNQNGWGDIDKKEYCSNYAVMKKDIIKFKKKFFDKKGEYIDFEYQYMKACQNGSNFLFLSACMVFFLLCFFPSLNVFYESSQNTLTIIGWTIVMSNYYYSSISEEKVKKELSERKQRISSAISIFKTNIEIIEKIMEDMNDE